MAISIHKNLTFSILKHAWNKNVHVRISPVSLSILPTFYSTQTQTHLDINMNPTVYDVLVHKHDFPYQFASRVASELTHVKNPETVDSMLSFFKSSGFSNAQLQKILEFRPTYLCYSLEDDIKPKIKSFQDEGFSCGDISKIISISPSILQLSLNNNIIPSLSVLKGLLGSKTAALTVVRRYPPFLTSNMETTVVANVEFMKSCGVAMDRIRIILKANPYVFCQNPQVISASVDKAKEMGLSVASKAFIYAIATIASQRNEAWELKLQALRDMGFSERDILRMFRKAPTVFAGSSEKMNKIMEGLVATGKFDISAIVNYPVSLGYSFEKRFEPQMRILRILESRSLIETWPTLATLCCLSDAEFFKRFVSPYLDQLSDVDIPNLIRSCIKDGILRVNSDSKRKNER